MRSAIAALSVFILLGSARSLADEAETKRTGDWLGTLTVGAPSLYFSSSGGTGGGDVSLSVGSEIFFQRLIDDPSHPLALLEFFQHPDAFTLTASLNNGWGAPVGHSYDSTVTAEGVWFFSERTGITASVSGNAQWLEPASEAGAFVQGTGKVGFQRYLTPWLRADGGVSLSLAPTGKTAGLYLRVTAVAGDERVLLEAGGSLDMGRVASARILASYFFGRRVSAGLLVSGVYWGADPVLTGSIDVQLQPRVCVTIYLTHALALLAAYGVDIDGSLATPGFVVNFGSNTSVTVSWRF